MTGPDKPGTGADLLRRAAAELRDLATYVAMMHPPVALALAEMLEEIAGISAAPPYLRPPTRAVALARAVLREGES
jgi:hypothetical protein